MATAGENIKYTAADFHRYHSGTMSEAEMHALEKAALEDPFLSDSLEGYAITKTGEEDILALKKRLAEKEENKKSILFILKNSVWVKVAAILVIMLGVIYFTNINRTDVQPHLAKKDDKILTELVAPLRVDSPVTYSWSTPSTGSGTYQMDTTRYLNAQSSTLTATAPANGEFTTTIGATGNSTYTITPSAAYGVTSDTTMNNNADADGVTEKNVVTANEKEKELTWYDKNNSNYYKGKVVDTKGEPIPFANITLKQKKEGTVTDTAGRFLIARADSGSIASVAAAGYSTTQTKLTNNVDQTIVLSPVSTELSTVQVTALGEVRQKASLGYSTAKPNKDSSWTLDPFSSDRKPAFDKYVATNIQMPKRETGEIFTGEVILSFKIKKDGTPYKIKIIKKLCDACDKEAIRLLTEGPKWNYKNEKRTTVSINFK